MCWKASQNGWLKHDEPAAKRRPVNSRIKYTGRRYRQAQSAASRIDDEALAASTRPNTAKIITSHDVISDSKGQETVGEAVSINRQRCSRACAIRAASRLASWRWALWGRSRCADEVVQPINQHAGFHAFNAVGTHVLQVGGIIACRSRLIGPGVGDHHRDIGAQQRAGRIGRVSVYTRSLWVEFDHIDAVTPHTVAELVEGGFRRGGQQAENQGREGQ